MLMKLLKQKKIKYFFCIVNTWGQHRYNTYIYYSYNQRCHYTIRRLPSEDQGGPAPHPSLALARAGYCRGRQVSLKRSVFIIA
jgi:hypothetical protein